MLLDAILPPLVYNEPWKASLEERVRMLGSGDRHVAYVYENPDTSTFRYRVFNMIEALGAEPGRRISASWFTRADLDCSLDFVDRADVLVICRTRYDNMIGRLVARARARGLRVLFDVDDLIFDSNYAHLIADTLDLRLLSTADWDGWFAYIARLGATLRLCDGAITTNSMLADCIVDYAPWMEPSIVPNFLNRAQMEVSRRIYERKRCAHFRRDRRIHVGYFSGSPTHNKDFRIVASALVNLLERDPRLTLRVVGFLDPTGELMRYRKRVETYPLQDFINLQRLQAEVEFNIAPLQNNIFTNCKSELKYFEAAIVGSVTIASPTPIFVRAIADGESGFLAGAHDWENKIAQVVALLDDGPQRYAAIAECAFVRAQQTYAWDGQAAAIEAALFENVLRT
jgi:glycosyltransferase involved in cell wall biosynthesis